MKKEYIKPIMEIINIEMQYNMLAGSGVSFTDDNSKGEVPWFEEKADEDVAAW